MIRRFKLGFIAEADMLQIMMGRYRIVLDPDTIIDDVYYSWPAGGYSLRLYNPEWPGLPDDERAPTVPLRLEKPIHGGGLDERTWIRADL